MGFNLRKRTKGKSLWLNGSVSSKGSHTSLSTKLSDSTTINSSSRGKRLTINFGHGLRYIISSKNNIEPSSPITLDSMSGFMWKLIRGLLWLILFLIIVGIIF